RQGIPSGWRWEVKAILTRCKMGSEGDLDPVLDVPSDFVADVRVLQADLVAELVERSVHIVADAKVDLVLGPPDLLDVGAKVTPRVRFEAELVTPRGEDDLLTGKRGALDLLLGHGLADLLLFAGADRVDHVILVLAHLPVDERIGGHEGGVPLHADLVGSRD